MKYFSTGFAEQRGGPLQEGSQHLVAPNGAECASAVLCSLSVFTRLIDWT